MYARLVTFALQCDEKHCFEASIKSQNRGRADFHTLECCCRQLKFSPTMQGSWSRITEKRTGQICLFMHHCFLLCMWVRLSGTLQRGPARTSPSSWHNIKNATQVDDWDWRIQIYLHLQCCRVHHNCFSSPDRPLKVLNLDNPYIVLCAVRSQARTVQFRGISSSPSHCAAMKISRW